MITYSPRTFSTLSLCFSYFLTFKIPLQFQLAITYLSVCVYPLCVLLCVSNLFLVFRLWWMIYFFGLGARRMFNVIISGNNIAHFNWIGRFSHLMGGSAVGRSQNGSMESGVFLVFLLHCVLITAVCCLLAIRNWVWQFSRKIRKFICICFS